MWLRTSIDLGEVVQNVDRLGVAWRWAGNRPQGGGAERGERHGTDAGG